MSRLASWGWWWRVIHSHDLAQASGEVAEQAGAYVCVHPFAGGEEPGHLVHALIESSSVFAKDGGVGTQSCCHLGSLQVPQVLHRHLQDVCFLQLGVPGAIFLQGIQDEGLQLPQALIDPGPAPLLHDRLGGLSVFTGTLGLVRRVAGGSWGTSNRGGCRFLHGISGHF